MKLINLKYISITFLSFIHKPLIIPEIQSFKIDMPDDCNNLKDICNRYDFIDKPQTIVIDIIISKYQNRLT